MILIIKLQIFTLVLPVSEVYKDEANDDHDTCDDDEGDAGAVGQKCKVLSPDACQFCKIKTL